MTMPNTVDVATLRWVAELADFTARQERRTEAHCRARKLPGEPVYFGRATALESLARCLRNRATRAERAQREVQA